MRYLLIGNGPVSDQLSTLADSADCIIQINDCKHAGKITNNRNGYVFLTNTGPPAFENVGKVAKLGEIVPFGRIVLARSPLYYKLKGFVMWVLGCDYRSYIVCHEYKKLKLRYPIRIVSFWHTLWLDIVLIRKGMSLGSMPSTGLIAYEWLRKEMFRGDSLTVEGFSFEGWDRHSWAIEQGVVKNIQLPFSWENQ